MLHTSERPLGSGRHGKKSLLHIRHFHLDEWELHSHPIIPSHSANPFHEAQVEVVQPTCPHPRRRGIVNASRVVVGQEDLGRRLRSDTSKGSYGAPTSDFSSPHVKLEKLQNPTQMLSYDGMNNQPLHLANIHFSSTKISLSEVFFRAAEAVS